MSTRDFVLGALAAAVVVLAAEMYGGFGKDGGDVTTDHEHVGDCGDQPAATTSSGNRLPGVPIPMGSAEYFCGVDRTSSGPAIVLLDQGGARTADDQGGARVANDQGGAQVAEDQGGAQVAEDQGGAQVAEDQGGAQVAEDQGGAKVAEDQGGAQVAEDQGGAKVAEDQGGAKIADDDSIAGIVDDAGDVMDVADENKAVRAPTQRAAGAFFCTIRDGQPLVVNKVGEPVSTQQK